MKNHSRALTAIAHHEAGHAVIGFLQGGRILGMSIAPQSGSLGHVRRAKRALSRHSEIHGEIACLLAGPMAYAKFLGRPTTRGMAGDWRIACGYADIITSTRAETIALLKWLSIRTFTAVEQSWPAIQSVAATLLDKRTLKGREAMAVIGAAIATSAPSPAP